jgi:hypothetical protein
MGWTKRQLAEQAYGELALAGYVFDLEPEEIQFAIVTMDTLMASWDGLGLRIGYALGLTPTSSDPDDDSGIALRHVRAVYLNLAVAIAASKGKALSGSTLKGAKDAYDALQAVVALAAVPGVQMPHGTPRGAGNRPWRQGNRPFFEPADTAPLQQNDAGNLDFLGS